MNAFSNKHCLQRSLVGWRVHARKTAHLLCLGKIHLSSCLHQDGPVGVWEWGMLGIRSWGPNRDVMRARCRFKEVCNTTYLEHLSSSSLDHCCTAAQGTANSSMRPSSRRLVNLLAVARESLSCATVSCVQDKEAGKGCCRAGDAF